MDVLYDDLENYREFEDVVKLKEQNKLLEKQLEEKNATIQNLMQDFDKLMKDYKVMEVNYSSLLKTARAEIERKTQAILELNREKDKLVIEHRINKNDKSLRNSNTFPTKRKANSMEEPNIKRGRFEGKENGRLKGTKCESKKETTERSEERKISNLNGEDNTKDKITLIEPESNSLNISNGPVDQRVIKSSSSSLNRKNTSMPSSDLLTESKDIENPTKNFKERSTPKSPTDEPVEIKNKLTSLSKKNTSKSEVSIENKEVKHSTTNCKEKSTPKTPTDETVEIKNILSSLCKKSTPTSPTDEPGEIKNTLTSFSKKNSSKTTLELSYESKEDKHSLMNFKEKCTPKSPTEETDVEMLTSLCKKKTPPEKPPEGDNLDKNNCSNTIRISDQNTVISYNNKTELPKAPDLSKLKFRRKSKGEYRKCPDSPTKSGELMNTMDYYATDEEKERKKLPIDESQNIKNIHKIKEKPKMSLLESILQESIDSSVKKTESLKPRKPMDRRKSIANDRETEKLHRTEVNHQRNLSKDDRHSRKKEETNRKMNNLFGDKEERRNHKDNSRSPSRNKKYDNEYLDRRSPKSRRKRSSEERLRRYSTRNEDHHRRNSPVNYRSSRRDTLRQRDRNSNKNRSRSSGSYLRKERSPVGRHFEERPGSSSSIYDRGSRGNSARSTRSKDSPRRDSKKCNDNITTVTDQNLKDPRMTNQRYMTNDRTDFESSKTPKCLKTLNYQHSDSEKFAPNNFWEATTPEYDDKSLEEGEIDSESDLTQLHKNMKENFEMHFNNELEKKDVYKAGLNMMELYPKKEDSNEKSIKQNGKANNRENTDCLDGTKPMCESVFDIYKAGLNMVEQYPKNEESNKKTIKENGKANNINENTDCLDGTKPMCENVFGTYKDGLNMVQHTQKKEHSKEKSTKQNGTANMRENTDCLDGTKPMCENVFETYKDGLNMVQHTQKKEHSKEKITKENGTANMRENTDCLDGTKPMCENVFNSIHNYSKTNEQGEFKDTKVDKKNNVNKDYKKNRIDRVKDNKEGETAEKDKNINEKSKEEKMHVEKKEHLFEQNNSYLHKNKEVNSIKSIEFHSEEANIESPIDLASKIDQETKGIIYFGKSAQTLINMEAVSNNDYSFQDKITLEDIGLSKEQNSFTGLSDMSATNNTSLEKSKDESLPNNEDNVQIMFRLKRRRRTIKKPK